MNIFAYVKIKEKKNYWELGIQIAIIYILYDFDTTLTLENAYCVCLGFSPSLESGMYSTKCGQRGDTERDIQIKPRNIFGTLQVSDRVSARRHTTGAAKRKWLQGR